MPADAIHIVNLSHRYGERRALDQLTLDVAEGELFAFLGPNGGGKTTLFRILSTFFPVQEGEVTVLGCSHREPWRIRPLLGVVFQSPSLDVKLTVRENLQCQAAMYGMTASDLAGRLPRVLEARGLSDRARDYVETLSGGLRRRVELAKCLLPEPRLLLMDEPSTGLDPGARIDLWQALRRLRDESRVTIALTTHLLEEAEKADRVAILNEGRLAAIGAPADLKRELGGESIVIQTDQPQRLVDGLRERFSLEPEVVDHSIRIAAEDAAHWVPKLSDAFGEAIQSITVGRPTLEDVFIHRTGRRFWSE